MREMVLNHASLLAPSGDRDTVSDWLRQLATGMGQLVHGRVVRRALRTHRSVWELQCLDNYSLGEAYEDLRRSGHRDEYSFLVRLSIKAPLLHEIGEQVKDRFLACEEKTLPPGDGDPLVLCAMDDGIAVGFPSASTWDRDRVTVRFNEMLPDQTIVEASEEIDQLTRPAHADPSANVTANVFSQAATLRRYGRTAKRSSRTSLSARTWKTTSRNKRPCFPPSLGSS